MVVTWIEGYFDSLHTAGYQSNELALTGIMVNLFNVRCVLWDVVMCFLDVYVSPLGCAHQQLCLVVAVDSKNYLHFVHCLPF